MEDDNKIIEEFEGLFGLTEESTDTDTDSEIEETVTETDLIAAKNLMKQYTRKESRGYEYE